MKPEPGSSWWNGGAFFAIAICFILGLLGAIWGSVGMSGFVQLEKRVLVLERMHGLDEPFVPVHPETHTK